MAVPRSKSERDRDRRITAELYLKGWTQLAIAEKLNLDKNTVNTDVKAIRAEWKKENEGMAEEFEAKYYYLYREAIAAWERSLQDAETTIQEMIDSGEPVKLDKEGNPIPAGQRLKASTRKEGQSGNPALLAQANAALKAIREMRGMDAPSKQTNVNIDFASLTDAQLQRIAVGEDPLTVIASTPGEG